MTIPRKSMLSRRLTPAGIALLYAAFAALWIVASSYLLTVAVADPVVLGRIELAKGLVFVSVTSILLYLLLRVRGTTAVPEAGVSPVGLRLVLIFVALTLIVPLIGFAIISLYAPQTEHEAYADLENIALAGGGHRAPASRAHGRSGYPRGRKGEEILLEARITAVADTVEAMSSHRTYRPGIGLEGRSRRSSAAGANRNWPALRITSMAANGVAQNFDQDTAKRVYGKLVFNGFILAAAYSERVKGIPTASFGTDVPHYAACGLTGFIRQK